MVPTLRTLFVYGTLMPGQPRWPVVAPFIESVAPALSPGILWDTGLGFPAATFGGSTREIPGFVITLLAEFCRKAMALLDEIEGEGVLYRRVEIETSQGRAVSYEWLGETSRLEPLLNGWCPTSE